MNYWWTSDTHFGHANIIKYCDRPFKDVDEMNCKLIENMNSRVKPEDTVFFLGDFCFKNSKGGKEGEGLIYSANSYIEQLQGNWVFVKGNHDRNNSLKTCIEKVYIKFGGRRMCMIHNPFHADPQVEINLCGHVHEKWKFRKLNENSDLINVGVDVWNFFPISFDEIMKEYHKWKRNSSKN